MEASKVIKIVPLMCPKPSGLQLTKTGSQPRSEDKSCWHIQCDLHFLLPGQWHRALRELCRSAGKNLITQGGGGLTMPKAGYAAVPSASPAFPRVQGRWAEEPGGESSSVDLVARATTRWSCSRQHEVVTRHLLNGLWSTRSDVPSFAAPM